MANNIKPYKAHNKRRRNQTLLVQAGLGVLIVALLFGISYASVKILHGQPVFPARSAQQQEGAPAPESVPPASQSAPTPSGSGAQQVAGRPETAVPVQAWNTEVPVERTLENDITASDSRLLAVPVNGRLSAEYFRTALFIGDSLSQGFALYAPTRDVATVCAYKSTSPNQVLQNFVGQRPDGSSIEMWDDIKVQSPSNIYVLYGTNALISQSDEAFLKYYSDLLDKLRERFAGVPIYVQSITPTTAAQGVKQPPLENGHIRLINNAIAKLAVSKGMYYLDAQEALADTDGNLRADYVGTYDGIHMNPTGYAAWADYILTHTVYSDYNRQFVSEGPYA